MDTFKASVQYGDFKGTSAADRADNGHDLDTFLKDKGLIQPDEFLIAASLWVGESKGGAPGNAYIKAYLFNTAGGNHGSVKEALDNMLDPIPVRAVDVPVSAEQFVSFFKRFSVMLTVPSLGIDGRDFEEQ